MNEQFEQWYCDNYWNFKAVENRKVFFKDGRYNHLDVDLAYNSWKAATKGCIEIGHEVLAPMTANVLASTIKKRFGIGHLCWDAGYCKAENKCLQATDRLKTVEIPKPKTETVPFHGIPGGA